MGASSARGALGPYQGARALITTRHHKCNAVAPPFAAIAGIEVETYSEFDTDSLGTFTGEVPRPGDMRQTAIAKARAGLDATGERLGIATEGSYGPHPVYPFLPGGTEVMVFLDVDTERIVCETLIEDRPSFAETRIRAPAELEAFAARVGFPEQGLILAPAQGAPHAGAFEKELTRWDLLLAALPKVQALSEDGCARALTDMRAHRNPTRMTTLGRLAERLATRVATPCPACGAGGFGLVGREPGLPCRDCGTPTRQTAATILGCTACDFEQRQRGPERFADPAGCDICNP